MMIGPASLLWKSLRSPSFVVRGSVPNGLSTLPSVSVVTRSVVIARGGGLLSPPLQWMAPMPYGKTFSLLGYVAIPFHTPFPTRSDSGLVC